jgi:hypothetical protein
MVYKYGERVKRGRRSFKKYAVGAIATIIMAGGAAFPALAASGDYCGSSANGCEHSSSNTICSGHGSFGAFGGRDNNFAGGASGDRTAYNNSTLCGNPQGAAGELNP